MPGETEIASRKERERAMRRNEIVIAACDVFASRGFNDATLEEIAEKAEFGKGTLYNYFDSKELLFDAVVEKVFENIFRIAGEACNNPERPLVDSFRNFSTALLDHLSVNAALIPFIMREIHRNNGHSCLLDRFREVVGVLEQPLIRARARGELGEGDTRELAWLYLQMLLMLSLRIFQPSRNSDSDERSPSAEEIAARRQRVLATVEQTFFHGVLARA